MSSPLDDARLDSMLDGLPALAGRPRRLEELTGGLTNRNVKITTPDAVFVARCCDTSSNLLGIDRDNEYVNSRAAAEAGVGAPVIDYRPELGILLLGFVEGRTLSNADFQQPGTVAKAATAIRTLHAGPRFRDTFDMFAKQANYLDVLHDNGFRIPADYLDHAERLLQARRVLTATDQTTVPCNNDLLAANFVADGDTMWLIDYEYSGNNDLRTGQHLVRVPVVRRTARGTGDRLLRPSAAAQDRPRQTARHRRDVRLGAVGMHPECHQPRRIRLLGLGHGALRGRNWSM